MCLFCFANLQKYWKSHAGENIFLVCLCLLYHMSTSLPCACGNGKTMPWCRTAAFPSACINMRYMRPAYAYLCGDNSGILRFLRAWQFTAVKTRVLCRFVNALTHSCLYHITPQNRFSPSAKEAFRACGKARSVCRKSLCGVAEKVFRWCGRAFPARKRGKLRIGICMFMRDWCVFPACAFLFCGFALSCFFTYGVYIYAFPPVCCCSASQCVCRLTYLYIMWQCHCRYRINHYLYNSNSIILWNISSLAESPVEPPLRHA